MPFSSTWSTESFDKEYAILLPQQRLAVDVLEGPVMVQGGPATGKTRLLAARIANLLQRTTAQPRNILCLAAAETGAIALRNRLQQLTGPDAQEVLIDTFPGFCEAILKDNPRLFDTSDLLPVSDLERIQLLTRLIDAFPKGHPLKRYRGDVYFEINNLLSLFRLLRQDGWTPDHITERVYENQEKQRAAAHEFLNFQELLRNQKRYEAEDVINWVIKAFEEKPSLLQHYQQQFQYIIIDDYQEITGAQQKLLQLLTAHTDRPNICVAVDMQRTHTAPERLTAQYKNSLVTILPHQPLSAPVHQPHVREYETAWQEMIGITLQVQQLLQQSIPAAGIGIICKDPAHRQRQAQYLQIAGIPVQNTYPVNIFEEPLAQKLMLLLNYLAAEQDIPHSGDEMLFELLHADWFNIPPAEIIQLTVRLSEKSTGENKASLRRLLYEKVHTPPADLFTPPVHAGWRQASQAVELLTGMASTVTLPSLFENMLHEAGITRFISQHPDQLWLQQVITTMSGFVQTATTRNPSLDLQELSKLLTLMQWQQIPLYLLQAGGIDKGVYLLTAEEAKETVCEYIFLADCNAMREDVLNRFHTAITHTQQHLIFSYSRTTNDGSSTAPANFLATTIQAQALPVEKVMLQPEIMALFRPLFQPEVMAPETGKPDEALISRLLEKFMLSATALNNYLYCPLEFYYQHLVRVPSRRNEATEFGSAIHHALEMLFRKMQSADNAFPSKAVFVDDFEQYMHRQRGSFTPEQFSRRMEYGREVLSNYYDQYIHSWNTIVAVERNFRNVIVNGVPLKGKIDKLEFDGRMVNIVDYKSGDPERAKAQMTAPGEAMPTGGNYWRQAVFYKIMVDNYQQKAWKVVSSELDLVEPDHQQQYHKEKLFITADQVAFVTQQIVNSWWRIQNRDFYTGCGKPGCYWCHFVKSNNLAVAWHLQST